MTGLRDVDLNLLVIFRAIMTHGSIAEAAKEVGLSASAVSHALARMRLILNDELFYRTAGGVKPTERARELNANIEPGLQLISDAISQQHHFVPQNAERLFSIQVADYVSGFFLPRLTSYILSDAPRVSINVLPFSVSAESVWDRVDLQIRLTPGRLQPEIVRSKRLFADEVVVVMRRDHPAAEAPMTAGLYAELLHVKLSQSATGTTVIEDALASRGLKRHIALTAASWYDIPDIVANSDLIAIAPRRLLGFDPRLTNMKVAPLPLEEVVFSFDLCWDQRTEHDPGIRWLRDLVVKIFNMYPADDQ